MGRWSRLLADRFLAWLAAPRDSTWLEVGCGTGALTNRVLAQEESHAVLACDRSPTFVGYAQAAVPDSRVTFLHAEARRIPQPTSGYDVVVSGLVLNFLPGPLAAVQAMVQAATTHGTVAAYVWDYVDGMGFLRLLGRGHPARPHRQAGR